MIKILFLSANPSGVSRLRLDAEVREIEALIRQSERRDLFEIITQWAIRPSELQESLIRYKPDVVHFNAHGSDSNKIVLEDSSNNSRPASAEALGRIFSLLKGNIRCVILDKCYEEELALAIADEIDCVVGIPSDISDLAAIKFSASFYHALGYGRSIEEAFDQARAALLLGGINEEGSPKLHALHANPKEVVLARIDIRARKDQRAVINSAIPEGIIVTGDYNVLLASESVIKRESPFDTQIPAISGERAFERIGAAVRLNLNQLEKNMEQSRRESGQFFKLTLIFSSIGFIIVLVGVILLLTGQVTAGVVTSISSIVPEVTALLFFNKDKELRKTIEGYHQHILNSQQTLTMIDVAETIKSIDEQDKMKQRIIFKVLNIEVPAEPGHKGRA